MQLIRNFLAVIVCGCNIPIIFNAFFWTNSTFIECIDKRVLDCLPIVLLIWQRKIKRRKAN